MNHSLTIGGAAALSGLPLDTLRYYERLGLLAPGRTAGGRRVYAQRDLLLLRFVARMRATDMPLDEIGRYLDLAAAGDATIDQRRALLEAHAERIQARIDAGQRALATIRFKLDHFDAIRAGAVPDGAACSTRRPARRPPSRRRASGDGR